MSTLKLNQVDFKKRKYKYSLYCPNCGKNNHLFNQCHNPITSYGLCCFLNPSNFLDINQYFENEKQKSKSYAGIAKNSIPKQQNNNNQVNTQFTDITNCLVDSIKYNDSSHRNNEFRLLMIKRQYSLAFMEFMRGKFDVDNSEYLFTLFEKMTLQEIDIICKLNDFVKIRKHMNFYNNSNKKFKYELENAKLKFNYISKLGILQNIINNINYKYKLKLELNKSIGPPPGLYNNETDFFKQFTEKINNKLNNDNDTNNNDNNYNNKCNSNLYTECEWLLPKGKREENETDLKTAIREFYEETGINPKYITIYKNIVPLEYTFLGLNGIEYRNVYFIAELNTSPRSVKFKYNLTTHSIELNHITNKFTANNKEVSKIEFLSLNQCKDITRDYEDKFRDFIQHIFNFYINFRKYFM